MIRIIDSTIVVNGPGKDDIRYNEYSGLSTDTKPTEGVATGSTFLEVDTSKVYFFDEVSATWIAAGGE